MTNKRQQMDDPNLDRSSSSQSDENPITLENMMKPMLTQLSETRQLIDSVRSEIKNVNDKIDAIKTEVRLEIIEIENFYYLYS